MPSDPVMQSSADSSGGSQLFGANVAVFIFRAPGPGLEMRWRMYRVPTKDSRAEQDESVRQWA